MELEGSLPGWSELTIGICPEPAESNPSCQASVPLSGWRRRQHVPLKRHSTWFGHIDSWRRVQIPHYAISSPSSHCSPPWSNWPPLSTLFSNTHSLCSSLKMRNKFFTPVQNNGYRNIVTVLYSFIVTFRKRRRKDEIFWTACWDTIPDQSVLNSFVNATQIPYFHFKGVWTVTSWKYVNIKGVSIAQKRRFGQWLVWVSVFKQSIFDCASYSKSPPPVAFGSVRTFGGCAAETS